MYIKKLFQSFQIIIFFIGIFSNAQSINGKISNEEGKDIPYPEILVTKENFKEVVIGDKHGNFEINLPENGTYLVEVRLNGNKLYDRKMSVIGDLKNNIILKSIKEIQIQEIELKSKKPLIEQKLDRLIFNVENTISSIGRDYFDVLNSVPGIIMNNNGGISAMGKNSSLYVNGRLLKLSGVELSDYLKGLPSDEISKIEVYTNPPAKFDAEGSSVINIITKKKSSMGFDLLLRSNYRQSTFPKHGSGIALNFNEKKVRISSSYSNNNFKSLMTEDEYIKYYNNDWILKHRRISKGNSDNYKFAIDYDLTSKDFLSFQFDGFNSNSNSDRDINTTIFNSNQLVIDSLIYTNNRIYPKRFQHSYNLNYKKSFDSLGKSIIVDFDYTNYNSKINQFILSNSYSETGNYFNALSNTYNNSKQEIKIYSAKIDYSNPIDDKNGFDTGYKFSQVMTDNNLQFWNIGNQGQQTFDENKSNYFSYKEINHALFISYYSSLFHLIDYEIGLRGEYTITDGYSETNNARNKRDYFKIFPTIYLQYLINDNNKLNLNYGKRITRPEYWRLNPFRFYTTPNTYLQGNPFLNPSFTHNIELLYSLKSRYFFTLYYTQTNDSFSNITEQNNETNTLVNNQINLNKSINTGIYATASFSYKKWYEASIFSQFAFRKEESKYLSSEFNYSTIWFYTSLNNFFVLSKKDKSFRSELSIRYATRSLQGLYKVGSTFDMSVGFRKSFNKDKWNISIYFNDIFYRTYYKIDVDYLDQKNGFIERNDTRMFTLGISYKFIQNKVEKTKERNSGNNDERKRIGN